MISRDSWRTHTASATVRHSQAQGGIDEVSIALREISAEICDPTIEVVDIVIHWDRVNSGTIDVTVQR